MMRLTFYCNAAASTVSNLVLCARWCHMPLWGQRIPNRLLGGRGMPARCFESSGRPTVVYGWSAFPKPCLLGRKQRVN